MSAFAAVIARDIRLSLRAGGDALVLVLFFVMVAVIVPFAVGPDRPLLTAIAPGIVWVAAFLAMLLGLDRLFRADAEDGALVLLRFSGLPLEALVLAKMIAHWLVTALPLIISTPLLALLLSMDWGEWGLTVLALVFGTPALTALGAVGAAVTVGLRGGGLLAPVLIVPLGIPVVIFGVGVTDPLAGQGALLFLAAISLITCAFSPFAAALALRAGAE